MKKIVLTAGLSSLVLFAVAQQYVSREGKITFRSETRVEKIEAINSKAGCVLDVATGDLLFQVSIKAFKFERNLMEEHFNENYLESDKYPNAVFKGKITNLSAVNFAKAGLYEVQASGKMTMHGVTRDVSAPGFITVNAGGILLTSSFLINPQDYKVEIPGLVAGKIARELDVSVGVVFPVKK